MSRPAVLTPEMQRNLKDGARQIARHIKTGKPKADGSGNEAWSSAEIDNYLNTLRIAADGKLSSSGGKALHSHISAQNISNFTNDVAKTNEEWPNDLKGVEPDNFLFQQIVISADELSENGAALSQNELLKKFKVDDLQSMNADRSNKSWYLWLKFKNIKSENELPQNLTFKEFLNLLALVSDVVHDGGYEMVLGQNREVNRGTKAKSKPVDNEEKAKLKAERQVLALVGRVNAAGKTTHNRIANIAIQLAKDPTRMSDLRDLDSGDATTADAAKKAISEKIHKIEEEAAKNIMRVLRANVGRNKLKKLQTEEAARIAKEKAEAEEAAKKALTDDGWPKYLSRTELGTRGYLPNPINIFGTASKDPASGVHHGSELHESGLVVQLFEDDGKNSPSGSFELSRQVAAIASSGAKTGVSFVRTKPFGGAESYQAVVATSVGVVQTFIDASHFEGMKNHATNLFKTELVGVLDQAAIATDFTKCLDVYEKALTRLKAATDPESKKNTKEIEKKKKEITKAISTGDLKLAFRLISISSVASSSLFTDAEKSEIRNLKNTTINKATDAQKETARALAASKHLEFIQAANEKFIIAQARDVDLDSSEIDAHVKKMRADPVKAKKLLDQPIPPCRSGSTAILRPSGNTATVLFNNDVSHNNIIYLAIPNTQNAYIRVMRIPEGGSVSVYKNGKLEMATSDKPGVIAIDDGVVWRCTKSGDHEPVELSSKGQGFPKHEWENVKANTKNFSVKAISVSGENRYMQTLCEGKVTEGELGRRIFKGQELKKKKIAGAVEVELGITKELEIKRDKNGNIIVPKKGFPCVVLSEIKCDINKQHQAECKGITAALVALPEVDPKNPQNFVIKTMVATFKDGKMLSMNPATEEMVSDIINGVWDDTRRSHSVSKEQKSVADKEVKEVCGKINGAKLIVADVDHKGVRTTKAVEIERKERRAFGRDVPIAIVKDPTAVLLAERSHTTGRGG